MKNYVVLSICLVESSCISKIASFKSFTTSWVGHPNSEYLEARALPHMSRKGHKGTERIMQLENGNLLYEMPYRKCPVFFEVDTQGIIIVITTKGDMDCW